MLEKWAAKLRLGFSAKVAALLAGGAIACACIVMYFGASQPREAGFDKLLSFASGVDRSPGYVAGEGYVTDVQLRFRPNDPAVWKIILTQLPPTGWMDGGVQYSARDPDSRVRSIWVDAKRGKGFLIEKSTRPEAAATWMKLLLHLDEEKTRPQL